MRLTRKIRWGDEMGLFDWLFGKSRYERRKDYGALPAFTPERFFPFEPLLQEARIASITLGKHIGRGDLEAAESACRSIEVQLADLSSKISSPSHRLALADRYFNFGALLRELKEFGWAERAFQSAIRLSTSASERHPDAACRQLAACQNHLGLLYQETNSLEQSFRAFEEALAHRETLLKTDPKDEENLVYLGGTLCNLGNVACDREEFENALAWYHRSIDILDRSIPGCDCGCRDVQAEIDSFMSGCPSPVLIAHQFLRNALDGRASALRHLAPDKRFVHVRWSRRGKSLVLSILTEKLVDDGTSSSAEESPLRQLRRELLDAVTGSNDAIVFDLQGVKEMDASGAALLLHLRQRLVGSGEWPVLCGLSNELRAATPAIRWEKLFTCHPTVDAAFQEPEGR